MSQTTEEDPFSREEGLEGGTFPRRTAYHAFTLCRTSHYPSLLWGKDPTQPGQWTIGGGRRGGDLASTCLPCQTSLPVSATNHPYATILRAHASCLYKHLYFLLPSSSSKLKTSSSISTPKKRACMGCLFLHGCVWLPTFLLKTLLLFLLLLQCPKNFQTHFSQKWVGSLHFGCTFGVTFAARATFWKAGRRVVDCRCASHWRRWRCRRRRSWLRAAATATSLLAATATHHRHHHCTQNFLFSIFYNYLPKTLHKTAFLALSSISGSILPLK